MSKMGNHVVGLQSNDDYKFGWQSAERGEPKPIWTCRTLEDMDRLQAQQFGWHSYHTQGRQP